MDAARSDLPDRFAAVTDSAGPFELVAEELLEVALPALPQADAMSLTVLFGDAGRTAAYTGAAALAVDECQYKLDDGPCLQAARAGVVIDISDMTTEVRWPEFTRFALDSGVAASLSMPLPIVAGATGALNVYAYRADAFDDAAREQARMVAAFAAVACARTGAYADASQRAHQMSEAMESRAVIEQAKGVIMGQNRCSAAEAYEILRSASMNRNVKLRHVAEQIVTSVATALSADKP